MSRPYVICHMIPSLDGRIVTAKWGMAKRGYDAYERTHKALAYDAWIIGRVSMAPYAGKSRIPARKDGVPVPRTDFVAPAARAPYAIGIDPAGKLAWKVKNVEGEHAITVLTEAVTDDYLAFLRARGVSYVFGGKRAIELPRVLEKLRKLFGIKRLALEGGGRINGHFAAADLIDEMSVIVAPLLDGSAGTPTLVDIPGGRQTVRHLKLLSCEALGGDLVRLRYKVKR
ncbi:MAG: RibD family protein [Gammaproteobacteria bacterium]